MLQLGLLQRDGGGRVLRPLDRRAGRVVLLVADEQTNGKGLLVCWPGLIRQLQGEIMFISGLNIINYSENCTKDLKIIFLPCTGALSCCIGLAR